MLATSYNGIQVKTWMTWRALVMRPCRSRDWPMKARSWYTGMAILCPAANSCRFFTEPKFLTKVRGISPAPYQTLRSDG